MDNVIKNVYTIEELEQFQPDFDSKIAIENLKNSKTDDFTKIFSVINLDSIDNINDFYVLIKHLTNCSNPLREAVALKLEDLYNKKRICFFDEKIKEKFLSAIVDINPNVSRAICSVLAKNKCIAENMELDIIFKINELLNSIEEFQHNYNETFFVNALNKKNHAKNKKLFALYWLLEALSFSFSNNYNSKVLDILNCTIKFCDYTIREKTAKILNKMENCPCNMLRFIKNDQNFYVKNQVYDKIVFED